MSFAALLRSGRAAKGWTQGEAATAIGVRIQEVWRWESGRNRPKVGRLAHIAAALGIPEAELATAYERASGRGEHSGSSALPEAAVSDVDRALHHLEQARRALRGEG